MDGWARWTRDARPDGRRRDDGARCICGGRLGDGRNTHSVVLGVRVDPQHRQTVCTGRSASGTDEDMGNVQGVLSFRAYGHACKLRAYSGCGAVCCVCACGIGRDAGTCAWTRAQDTWTRAGRRGRVRAGVCVRTGGGVGFWACVRVIRARTCHVGACVCACICVHAGVRASVRG